jgi:hypothetical protein
MFEREKRPEIIESLSETTDEEVVEDSTSRPNSISAFLRQEANLPTTVSETRHMLQQAEIGILNAVLDDPNHEALRSKDFPEFPLTISYNNFYTLDSPDATVLRSTAKDGQEQLMIFVRTDGTSVQYCLLRTNATLISQDMEVIAFHGEDIKRPEADETPAGWGAGKNALGTSIFYGDMSIRNGKVGYEMFSPDYDENGLTPNDAERQNRFACVFRQFLADYDTIMEA